MKTRQKLSAVIPGILLVLASCGGGEPDKKAALDLLETEKKDLNSKLAEINHQIDSLKRELGIGEDDRQQVSYIELNPQDFQNSFEVQGTIEAEKNVLLNAEMGGLIKRILVEEGQTVTAGQTLAILDADVIAKNIEEMEKSLELAKFVFEKQKNLHDQNIGSELQYQQAKNNKERLEQSLQTLKTQQSKAVVTAPFSGYIEEIFSKEGEMAMPQMPIIRLLDLKKVKIIANVMEGYLSTINKNTKVNITISSLDTTITDISLTRIGKFVNPSNRTFEIEAKLDNKNEKLLPNLVAAVKIKNDVLKNQFVVPAASVMQSSAGQDYIFVIETEMKEKKAVEKVEKRVVERVATDRETQSVVIRSDEVRQGDKVVVDGARGVKAGMEVKASKK